MSPKPSLYMQGSMALALYMQGSMALASPVLARSLHYT